MLCAWCRIDRVPTKVEARSTGTKRPAFTYHAMRYKQGHEGWRGRGPWCSRIPRKPLVIHPSLCVWFYLWKMHVLYLRCYYARESAINCLWEKHARLQLQCTVYFMYSNGKGLVSFFYVFSRWNNMWNGNGMYDDLWLKVEVISNSTYMEVIWSVKRILQIFQEKHYLTSTSSLWYKSPLVSTQF